MSIPFTPYPIGKDVTALRFVWKGQHIRLWATRMHLYRIFQHIHLGMSKKKIQIFLQCLRTKLVIRINKGDILTSRLINAPIACFAQPTIGLMNYHDI